jgi:hypothetical protein
MGHLGIDFSGNHQMWSPRCGRSNVWVASVEIHEGRAALVGLEQVQRLSGDGNPFARLARLLREGEYQTASIDAPFSVPRMFMPSTGYAGLLDLVGSAVIADGRPFPIAAEFVKLVTGQDPPLNPPKPLRSTEVCWRGKGLNGRSTLWAGSRGGAAMTAACLKLLHSAGRPIWPWDSSGSGLLVEAFPMAQLKQWDLLFPGYGKPGQEGEASRKWIIEGLRGRIDLREFEGILAASADALDAVLCCFAGIAVATSNVTIPPDDLASLEGWIAVHS